MKMKNFLSSMFAILVIGSASVTAQTTGLPQQQEQIEVSKKELTEFAQVFQQMRLLNQEAQKEMIEVVKNEDFELQRFNEIHQAKLDPNKEIETTDIEDKKYSLVVAELKNIQPEFQKKIQELISESNLSMAEYQQIAMALKNDPEIQQRLQAIMKG
jgi:hypothetical protein